MSYHPVTIWIKVQDITQKNAKVQTIILKNKDRKQMWKTIKTLDAKEQEIEEIGRTLISAMI